MKPFDSFEKECTDFRCAVPGCYRRRVRLTDQGALCPHHYLTASRCAVKGCTEIGPFEGYCRDHYMEKEFGPRDCEDTTLQAIVDQRKDGFEFETIW